MKYLRLRDGKEFHCEGILAFTKALVDEGAEVYHPGRNCVTPLQLAPRSVFEEMVRILTAARAR